MDSFTPVEIPEYTVPSVIGKTVEEAEAMQEVFGSFELIVGTGKDSNGEFSGEFSAEYPEGQIIHQTPDAGKQGKNAKGELIPITVVLSLGARSGEMLNLIDADARDAKLKLEQTKGLTELHLNVVISDEEEFHEEVAAGHVIRTDPIAGTALKEGDTITLTVSRGPEPKYSTMVTCVGQTVEWVQMKMAELNLVPEFQKVEGSAAEGTVLSQSINASEEVLQGSTVTFTYSDGEKLLPLTVLFTTPVIESDEGEEKTEMRVQIFLDNENVFDSMLPGEYPLEQTIYAKAGSYRLRIYANDQIWRDETVTFSDGE